MKAEKEKARIEKEKEKERQRLEKEEEKEKQRLEKERQKAEREAEKEKQRAGKQVGVHQRMYWQPRSTPSFSFHSIFCQLESAHGMPC